jgi:hypothetical protein
VTMLFSKLIKLLCLDLLVRPRPDTFGNRFGTDPYARWREREEDKILLRIPLMFYLLSNCLFLLHIFLEIMISLSVISTSRFWEVAIARSASFHGTSFRYTVVRPSLESGRTKPLLEKSATIFKTLLVCASVKLRLIAPPSSDHAGDDRSAIVKTKHLIQFINTLDFIVFIVSITSRFTVREARAVLCETACVRPAWA